MDRADRRSGLPSDLPIAQPLRLEARNLCIPPRLRRCTGWRSKTEVFPFGLPARTTDAPTEQTEATEPPG